MTTQPFETIAVVGAGTMGTQIALQCAVYGYPVWLVSRSEATLQRAPAEDEDDLQEAVSMRPVHHGVASAHEPAGIHASRAADIAQVLRRNDAGPRGRSA